ncbi:hypothetical protein V496_02533, partial [Pseudogymnoascus sp. VKM F-4515 (FW-2607)]
MARFRIDDFDPLDEVLKKISKLSRGLDEAVHLSDWAALVRLPRPCSSANTHELFYPDAPNDVLADLSDQGHLYRQSGLLVGLEHGHYHNAARYVLDNAGQEYIDIQALLRTGRRDGKILLELISHVTRWINCEPTKVMDRENNKPQLWRDFIPALTIEHDRRAPRKSCDLQREIFACAEGRMDQLEGSLGGDISDDTYIERFRSPAWRDILMTVRDAAGGQLLEILATFELPDPKSALCEQEPALIKALSFAIGRLPEVRDNPALRVNRCVEELMRRISPIVIEWAVQNSQKGLAAQATRKVPRWPLSIWELVEKQLQALTGMSASPTAAMESEEDLSVCTPLGISLGTSVKMLKPPPPPPPSWAGRVVTEKRLSAEPTDGTGESREVNAGESRRTKPVSLGVLLRQARARAARAARLAPSVVAERMRADMGSGPLYTPPMISPGRVELPRTPVRDVSWIGSRLREQIGCDPAPTGPCSAHFKFEEAFLAGTHRNDYLSKDECCDMSEMFDLDGASQGVEDSVVSRDYELPVLPRLTERERLESPSMATMTATELPSNDDDSLFAEADSESELEIEDEDSDTGNSGDETTNEDRMLQWKVDYTSSDHKLQVTNFIEKAESVRFDGIQALEVLHRLHTIDYGSRRAGSKAAKDSGEYHPLFFLDYICIVGRPLKAITRTSDRFFDNVTVTLKDWHLPGHLRDVVYRDAPNRGACAGAGRLATKTAGATSQVESVECSPHPPRTGHGLTHQARLPLRGVAENEPVFYAYDYGANIEIEVSEGVQTLGRETRLRPCEDSDDEADDDAGGDEGSAAGGDESQPRSVRGEGQSEGGQSEGGQSEGGRSVGGTQAKWPLEPNISYALAVDLNCLDADDPEQKSAVITVDVGDDILPLSLPPSVWELYVARAAAVPPGSCLCSDEGQYELLERRCRRSVVRLLPGVQQHQAVDPVQSRGSPTKGSARVRAIQQRLLRRMQGTATPNDPDASRPFARERQRIQHAVAETQPAYDPTTDLLTDAVLPARNIALHTS